MFESLDPSRILGMVSNRRAGIRATHRGVPEFKTEVITSVAPPFDAPKSPTLETKVKPAESDAKQTPKQDLDQLAAILELDLAMVSEEVTAPPSEEYRGLEEFNLDLVLQNLKLDPEAQERVKILDSAKPFDNV
jgi:hypothetical protein